MRIRGSYVLCAFVILTLAAPSHSYILPAKQILGFMVEQLGSGPALVVSQQTVLYDPESNRFGWLMPKVH